MFARQISRNSIHREKFYTAHLRYDRNNAFNQVLRLAVGIVAKSARSYRLQGAAKALLVWLEEIDHIEVAEDTFSRLPYGRTTERYRPAMALARMIILNYQPDVRAGSHDVLAILFDMNDLFEEYILRQLRRASSGGRSAFADNSRCASGGRTMRPGASDPTS